jgi:hypothetical protein
MNDPLSQPLSEPSPGNLRALLDILVDPLAALSRAVRHPKSGWVPYLVLILAAALAVVVYFSKVDGSWLIEHILARIPRAARAHAAREVSLSVLYASTLAGVVLGTSVGLVIVGAYYYVMLSLAGRDVTFFRMLSLAAWTSFPTLFGTLAAMAVVAVSGPHIPLSALNPTALAYLLDIHPGARLYDAASSFSLLMPWTWGLAVYAFVRLYRYRLDRALALVLVPYLIYYVVVALL